MINAHKLVLNSTKMKEAVNSSKLEYNFFFKLFAMHERELEQIRLIGRARSKLKDFSKGWSS